jgi:biopolymer transport protein ExbB
MSVMHRIVICILLIFCALGKLWGSEISAEAMAQQRLRDCINKLDETRQKIDQERVFISTKLSKLRSRVSSLRQEAKELRFLVKNKSIAINSLREQIKQRQDDALSVLNMMEQFVQDFAAQINIGEVQNYPEELEFAFARKEDKRLEKIETFDQHLKVLQSAFVRLENLTGGYIFEGNAFTSEGVLEKGEFCLVGPVAIFSSNESAVNGLVVQRPGLHQAWIVEIGNHAATQIRNFFAKREGSLPVDPTFGNAIKMKKSLGETIKKGGVILLFILCLGVITLFIAFYKWLEISRIQRVQPNHLQKILDFLHKGKMENALDFAKKFNGVTGQLLVEGIKHSSERKALIEEVFNEQIVKAQAYLNRWIPFIAVAATTAPLLGLLGTVTGMVKTFKFISIAGSNDPAGISVGISEALITTEFGLFVAIPSLIIHALLKRYAKSSITNMEQTAIAFVNGIDQGSRD